MAEQTATQDVPEEDFSHYPPLFRVGEEVVYRRGLFQWVYYRGTVLAVHVTCHPGHDASGVSYEYDIEVKGRWDRGTRRWVVLDPPVVYTASEEEYIWLGGLKGVSHAIIAGGAR